MTLKLEHTLELNEGDQDDSSKNGTTIVTQQPPQNKLARNLIICIGSAAAVLFTISTIGCIFVYLNLETYKYDTEEMGKQQPILLKKVLGIAEKMTDPLAALALVAEKNQTCFTAPCIEAALTLLESMDFAVNPCEDFYTFSCGNWIKKNPSANSSTSSDQFSTISDKVTKVTKVMLKSVAKSKGNNKALLDAKGFYSDCINLEQLENDGLQPVLDLMSRQGDWPMLYYGNWNSKHFNWIRTAADLQRISISAIIGVDIKQNIQEAASSVIFLTQPSLFLSREYLSDTAKHAEHIQAYKTLIVSCAKELGKVHVINSKHSLTENFSTATTEEDKLKYYEKVAEDIIGFEKRIANISFDEENRFNQHKNYLKLYNLQEETDLYTYSNSSTKIEWQAFLDRVFISSGVSIGFDEQVTVQESNYFFSLAKFLNYTSEETLANYLMFRLMAKFATGTTAAMRNYCFEYYQKIYGVRVPPARETTCTSVVNEKFGTVIGMEYIQANFDYSIKREVLAVAQALKEATEETLERSNFLPGFLKPTVIKRLQSLKNCIGFPESFSNRTAVHEFYSDLTLEEDSYLGKYIQISHWMFDKNLRRLRMPFDSNCWGGSYWTFIGEAYAYYDTARNSINFPVGILQPPFYRKGAPVYLNYGGIGSIIGHELTHSLNLDLWIKLEIAKDLQVIENCLVDHYSNFDVPEAGPNSKIDGYRTRSENFADHVGLAASFRAFKQTMKRIYNKRQTLPGLELFTPEQLFYVSFANMWCVNGNKEFLKDELEASIHTPAKFRVLGSLRNSDDFAHEWNCPIGSYMHPRSKDSQRCTIAF